MKALPIFVSLTNKPVLVVGGGDVALRKIETLIKTGAKVTSVAHHFCEPLLAISAPNLTLIQGDYTESLLEKSWLVIAATDDEDLNNQVHLDALKNKIFVNVVDDPSRCHFITPAIIDRSPLVIAISSGGDAPVLARLWKEKLEALLPHWLGRFAKLAGNYRQQVKHKINNFTERRHFWERVFRGQANVLASQENWPAVEKIIAKEITNENQLAGSIFYVNIGDNDIDNLTLKALQTMQLADVVLYDTSVQNAIIDLCRKDSHKHHINQPKVVNEILMGVEQKQIMVRLITASQFNQEIIKNEMESLKAHNHHVQYVPGINFESNMQ